jgi:hypothetical protein
MTKTKQILAALALVASASSIAVAQTDFGSPIGAGAGLGAAVAPLGVPGGNGPGGTAGLSGNGAQGLANARAAFMNATGGGATVQNPAGGTVTVPQAAAQALGGVLGGNPTAAQVSTLTSALNAGSASAPLVQALQALGGNASTANLGRAIAAFNAAVDATPAGANPSPALLAVRQALAAASR